jgi:hypothetical protein
MSIVVEQQQDVPATPTEDIVSWVKGRVDRWREFRDSQHKDKWDEYYRIWRGIWADSDKSRKSERAKIITPASMQALDSTVAEIEESVFGREQWFDLLEDVVEAADAGQVDEMTRARDRLLEKLELYDVPIEMAKCFLIGAIFGTGIGKIVVDEREVEYGEGVNKEVCVEMVALEPYEFIPDPTTEKIDKMLGMAHETVTPLHEVKRMQKDGVYLKNASIRAYSGEKTALLTSRFTDAQMPHEDSVLICEYHGLVPASMLVKAMPDKRPLDDLLSSPDDDILVEAIVTYANDSELLRAIANPFWNKDRSFVAYQHDTVPKYFWGRGVIEKAYHSQKGLDSTVRARLDALGLVAHPMIAGDVTRLPRGMNLGVWPGKFWPTTGAPGDVLTAFSLGQINPALFENAADMERMVQTATGAMDPGAAYNPGQAGGATNTALNASSFIKRSRRTMQNIERSFIRPAVHKIYARYAQFAPDGQWPKDLKFKIKGTLGIMAREFEQQQLTQLLSLVPSESKPFFVMARAIFDNSSSPHKADISAAIEEWINPPQDPEAQAMAKKQAELQMRQMEAQVVELEAKAEKARAEGIRAMAQAKLANTEAEFKDDEQEAEAVKNAINLREVEAFEVQNSLSMLMQQLKAFDLALKAKKINADVKKIESDANQIRD